VFPAEQLTLAAESFYLKLAAADQYQPTGRFSGTISLVRAKDNFMKLGDDYGLTQVSYYMDQKYTFSSWKMFMLLHK
jgi:fatty acid synthase